MLRSVEKRRDVDARFYKPTCLLAVIDGIGDASLAPCDLDPERVFGRFKDYPAAAVSRARRPGLAPILASMPRRRLDLR